MYHLSTLEVIVIVLTSKGGAYCGFHDTLHTSRSMNVDIYRDDTELLLLLLLFMLLLSKNLLISCC